MVRRSKLDLVDLAGTERPSTAVSDAKAAQEAKSLQRSLHYLEQVFLALQERGKGTSRQVEGGVGFESVRCGMWAPGGRWEGAGREGCRGSLPLEETDNRLARWG